MTFGISEKSKHKEEAWRFVREYLLEKYQDNVEFDFPVRKTSFEKAVNKAKNAFSFSYADGKNITVKGITDDETEKFEKMLSGKCVPSSNDSRMTDIVNEQLDMYFAGEQTAEDTASEIQRKVKLYMNER